jgi:isopentenyl phosphate kinase
MELVLVKLGGSVITSKYEDGRARIKTNILRELCDTIASAFKTTPIILLHGVGSFGHRDAQKYLEFRETRGKNITNKDLRHVIQSRRLIQELNFKIIKELWRTKLPAVSIFPSSCILAKSGEIKEFNIDPVLQLLSLGFLPVIQGDWAADEQMPPFSVISSDKIASYLAPKLGVARVVMVTSEDGVFSKDPVEKDAEFIKVIDKNNACWVLSQLRKSCIGRDATSEMYGKVMELLKISDFGIPSIVVKGTERDRVFNAITGKNIDSTKCTVLQPYSLDEIKNLIRDYQSPVMFSS